MPRGGDQATRPPQPRERDCGRGSGVDGRHSGRGDARRYPRFRRCSASVELVRMVDGVAYYNDSIATAPERSIASMRSFRQPVILIAGVAASGCRWRTGRRS